MKAFKFQKRVERGIYSYFYVREDDPFIEKNWRGLSDGTVSPTIEHFELSDKPVKANEKVISLEDMSPNIRLTEKTPFNQYCINNVNREEVAVYLGLIWRLSSGLRKYGIPSYYRETTAEILNKSFESVIWEYVIEEKDEFSDREFQNARSWSDSERRVVDVSGLFEINSFRDLILMQNSVQRDASSNINLFCLESDNRKMELLQALRGEDAPELKNILRENEIFIDLAIGTDPGYCDVLLIKSVRDIESHLNAILKEYTASIIKYEQSVGELKTLDQFLTAIAKMINIYH